MSTIQNAPPAVKVEFTAPDGICPLCDGTGCGRCQGTGGCDLEQSLDLVACACGFECTGAAWIVATSPLCPRCGTDLEAAIEAQWPEARDDDGFRELDEDGAL